MSHPLAVFARRGRPVTPEEIAAALAPVAQQGPDGRGVWQHANIALAHLALAETPEMAFEQQPAPLEPRLATGLFAGAPSDIVISADVRLDNRDELAAHLQIPRGLLPTVGDSQLILAAYLHWGETCAARLLGDFAFIIWDGPQHKVVCARDPVGCKPLFTYVQPDLFLAAGDVRALIGHPQGPRQPNLTALAYYLREPQFNHPTMTYLDGVTGLLPAHTLIVTADQVSLQRYWFPDRVARQPRIDLNAATEELRARLDAAVAARMRRVHGVGAHMSGGLDSTSLAYLAARHLSDPLPTYSWQPPPPNDAALATSEYTSLHTAIAHGAVDHTAVNVTVGDVVHELTRDICHHHTAIFVYEPVVRRAAAAANVRVLLSGWGGDEVVTSPGVGYVAEMFWSGHWQHVARFLMTRPVAPGYNAWRNRLGSLYRSAFKQGLPDVLYQWGQRFNASTPQPHAPLPPYIVYTTPELGALVAELPPQPSMGRRTSVHSFQLAALNFGHLHRRMEGWAMDGADGQIVYRYPLLDRRLLEFALSLPAEAYVQGNLGRYLFRRALSDTLPATVAWGVAKQEPARVQALITLMAQALLPALDATTARLRAHHTQPHLDPTPLRDHLVQRTPTDGTGDVILLARAIQVLGASAFAERS